MDPLSAQAAPGVLATARSRRWDPAEVVRILLEEEVRGRDEAGRRIRRKAAGLPAGKTFGSWREDASSIPLPAQHALMTLEWDSVPTGRRRSPPRLTRKLKITSEDYEGVAERLTASGSAPSLWRSCSRRSRSRSRGWRPRGRSSAPGG